MHLHLDSLILLAWELWRLGWNMAVRSWFSPPIDGRNFLRSISSLMDSSLNFSIKMDQGILFFFLMSWIMTIMSESRIFSSLTHCNSMCLVHFCTKIITKNYIEWYHAGGRYLREWILIRMAILLDEETCFSFFSF